MFPLFICKEAIAALTADIEALADGIKQLDKDVAEATEQLRRQNAIAGQLRDMETFAGNLAKIRYKNIPAWINPCWTFLQTQFKTMYSNTN